VLRGEAPKDRVFFGARKETIEEKKGEEKGEEEGKGGERREGAIEAMAMCKLRWQQLLRHRIDLCHRQAARRWCTGACVWCPTIISHRHNIIAGCGCLSAPNGELSTSICHFHVQSHRATSTPRSSFALRGEARRIGFFSVLEKRQKKKKGERGREKGRGREERDERV